ncbi:MAG TPA: hypothetical protein VK978_03550 [Candidatus Saccharimonadales bacterium]|nr:hypothetical protein [Candidatus Saccharimonadales bacterium]
MNSWNHHPVPTGDAAVDEELNYVMMRQPSRLTYSAGHAALHRLRMQEVKEGYIHPGYDLTDHDGGMGKHGDGKPSSDAYRSFGSSQLNP